ncbi:hypothetical protein NMY22_g14470 [Coprinellus aureogranulatus]|nr:hypothetical protein NMY22_g14470 [Coprinellus aureogranulatus]
MRAYRTTVHSLPSASMDDWYAALLPDGYPRSSLRSIPSPTSFPVRPYQQTPPHSVLSLRSNEPALLPETPQRASLVRSSHSLVLVATTALRPTLPTDVQKSKPSLYNNEIFAANTLLDVNNSDSDSEDVSALETMLQERRRQLDLARSKLRSQASQGTHQLMKDEERKPTEAPFDPSFNSSAHHAFSSQRRVHGFVLTSLRLVHCYPLSSLSSYALVRTIVPRRPRLVVLVVSLVVSLPLSSSPSTFLRSRSTSNTLLSSTGHRAFAGLGRTSNPLHTNYRALLATLQLEPTARGFQVLQVLDADRFFKCHQALSNIFTTFEPESQETVRATYLPPVIRLYSPSSSTLPYTQELLVKSQRHAKQSSESHVEPTKGDPRGILTRTKSQAAVRHLHRLRKAKPPS